MGECNMEDMPLPALFEQARKIHLTATDSGADQDLAKKGCEVLGKCEDMISNLGLFSSNEKKDDISTTNLKYLLAPLYLAELTEKLAHDDRIQIFKTSQAKLNEGENEFSQAILDDRPKKIEAWHCEAAAHSRYTKPAPPITHATFVQDVIEGQAKVSQAHDHKHQPMIFGPESLIGGSLTTERERMAAQVFEPGHRMPTMSIEEAGLREMDMMNKWQERNAKVIEEANSAWYKDSPKLGPSEDDEDNDAAQEETREWDHWKDDNPRATTRNKKLTPCG